MTFFTSFLSPFSFLAVLAVNWWYYDCAFAALYDERSIRSHVRRSRELLSVSTLHGSLSTLLALQHETAQQKTSGSYVRCIVQCFNLMHFVSVVSYYAKFKNHHFWIVHWGVTTFSDP